MLHLRCAAILICLLQLAPAVVRAEEPPPKLLTWSEQTRIREDFLERRQAALLPLMRKHQLDWWIVVNEEFHDGFLELAKSAQLTRALEHVLSLPFAPPSALLMVHAALPESWEILLVAQHQHHGLVDAIARREGARADSIAREHARIARVNLDIAVQNRHLLERVPGSTLLRLPAVAS